MRTNKCAGLWLALCLAWVSAARAEGEIRDRIAVLDAQIRQNPRSAVLYLMRGELQHVQENWDAALADYDKVTELNPALTEVELLRGQTLFAAGRLDKAKAALDKFLDARPNDVDGFVTRARIELKQGKPLDAAADFTTAIAHSASPDVQLFIERFQAFVAAGPDHLADALGSLDDGIAKLGPLVALQQPAIELELTRKNYDAALARLDMLRSQFESKEAFLARRGEILEQAGRKDEARDAYSAALQAIEAQPANQRGAVSTMALEKRLRASVARLTAK